VILTLRSPAALRGGLVLGALLLAGAGGSAHAADAAAGQKVAERWCASCHVVTAQQERAQSDAPSFAAIAAGTANLSAPWLAFRLLKPHPQMPQVSLTQAEAENLAAYFASLKR